jgi:hypothetical protein
MIVNNQGTTIMWLTVERTSSYERVRVFSL